MQDQISQAIEQNLTSRIIVRDNGRTRRFVPHQDSEGWYIRTDKRGTRKVYLTSVENVGSEEVPLHRFTTEA